LGKKPFESKDNHNGLLKIVLVSGIVSVNILLFYCKGVHMFRKTTSKRMLLIVFSLTIIAMLGTSSLAMGAATTKSLSSNYTLVNLSACNPASACAADVTVKYIKDDGSTWNADPANTNFTVPGNYGLAVVRQYSDATLSEGRGSVVVSSGEPLGSVVQLMTRGNPYPTKGAYAGVSQGSSKYYIPIAEKFRTTGSGLGKSQIIVQNADSVTISSATIDLVLGSSITLTKQIPSLAPGQSFFYDLTDESDTVLPKEWIGSAVVTAVTPATGKLAVVSNLFTGDNGMQTFNGFPAESVGPKWLVPLFLVRLDNGVSTPVSVQNLSGGIIPAGGIVLSCNADASFADATPAHFEVSNPRPLNNNEGYGFNPVVLPGGADGLFPMAKPWGGTCQIDAGTYNIVALVQLRYVGVYNQGTASYEALPISGTNKTVVVPLVAERLANGFATVVTVANLTTTVGGSATVNLKYTPSSVAAECPPYLPWPDTTPPVPPAQRVYVCDKNHDGVVDANDVIEYSATIAPGGSLILNHVVRGSTQEETHLPDRWQGTLVVTSADQPINGFVQLRDYLNSAGDSYMAHDAFSLP
jgi:hypothetical protein